MAQAGNSPRHRHCAAAGDKADSALPQTRSLLRHHAEDSAGNGASSITPKKSESTAVTIPIYYLPVVTAALYCGTWLTLVWTFVASAAYCSYLYPAMQEYDLTPEAFGYLALRILFFFLAAMVVNRFAQQSQHQTQLYRELAERLAETNRRLEQAQAEARRSERLAALGQLSPG
jgi:K+-sensing histidine kinase KdpD